MIIYHSSLSTSLLINGKAFLFAYSEVVVDQYFRYILYFIYRVWLNDSVYMNNVCLPSVYVIVNLVLFPMYKLFLLHAFDVTFMTLIQQI